ncbi:A-kinase anchor protein 9 isoform X1 [Tachysurus ichikawai]
MLCFLSVFYFLFVHQLRRSGEGDEDKDEEREEKKKTEQCAEEKVMVTSQLTLADTQERVPQVLVDMLKMAALMEESVRDKPITHPDVPEMDNSILLSGATDTDEGLDMSQEASPAVEGAGSLWSVSSRLQKAVEKLIFTLTETQIQTDRHTGKQVDRQTVWMESYWPYCSSRELDVVWEDGADMYEVESRVPLPRPFPLTICLNEKNAVIVKTHITHLKRHTHGHLLRIVTKISLPTPPYSLDHARLTQTELMKEKFSYDQQIADLLTRQEEQVQRLEEERKAREKLTMQLRHAEALTPSFTFTLEVKLIVLLEDPAVSKLLPSASQAMAV